MGTSPIWEGSGMSTRGIGTPSSSFAVPATFDAVWPWADDSTTCPALPLSHRPLVQQDQRRWQASPPQPPPLTLCPPLSPLEMILICLELQVYRPQSGDRREVPHQLVSFPLLLTRAIFESRPSCIIRTCRQARGTQTEVSEHQAWLRMCSAAIVAS